MVPEIHSLLFQLCQAGLLFFHIFPVILSLGSPFLVSLKSVHQSVIICYHVHIIEQIALPLSEVKSSFL